MTSTELVLALSQFQLTHHHSPQHQPGGGGVGHEEDEDVPLVG